MEDCIFCKIAAKEVSAEILMETDDLVAFRDINPQAPVHVLIVPKKHIPTVNALEEEDAGLIGKLVLAAKEIAKKEGVAESGYRLIFNVEKGGGQLVFHLHMHLTGGWE